jgi:hypothetical protein
MIRMPPSKVMLVFNIGWMCKECGPVQESKKRSINKVQWDCCKVCGGIVTPWERPLNERSGRCGNCGNGSFKLAMFKGNLLRCCKKCDEVVNTDQNCKITRKGNKVR